MNWRTILPLLLVGLLVALLIAYLMGSMSLGQGILALVFGGGFAANELRTRREANYQAESRRELQLQLSRAREEQAARDMEAELAEEQALREAATIEERPLPMDSVAMAAELDHLEEVLHERP